MKKTLFAALVCLTFFACNNDKAEEKKAMDDILATHEKVMAVEDKAMANKIKLDSLAKLKTAAPDSSAQKAALTAQSVKLNIANEHMENWMHQFDPDYKGKSHADAMRYLDSQKVQIEKINAQLNDAIKQSDKFLADHK